MSLSLVEALGQVDLQEGRIYRCRINDQWIELRVLKPSEVETVSTFDESDVMLDPWIELPRPSSGIAVRATIGSVPLPDVPVIITSEEDLI